MIVASVARRYARALLSLGLEEGHHEKFGEELEGVLQALEASREAGAILRNPGYTLPQRHAAADALAAGVNLSPVVMSFVRLLVDRQRIAYLPAIARAYRAMVDQQVGRVRAIVSAAAPLAEKEIEELRAAIAAMTGRTIVLDTRIDPSLIGGVVTQVGATMLDGSLRTQLERMREELKRGPLVA